MEVRSHSTVPVGEKGLMRIEGHVFPGANLPFGMAKAVADVDKETQGGFASNDGLSELISFTTWDWYTDRRSNWVLTHARQWHWRRKSTECTVFIFESSKSLETKQLALQLRGAKGTLECTLKTIGLFPRKLPSLPSHGLPRR